ncbi:PhnD/SsuA/transferrin family substrate-binding protein [Pseudooceanicola sp.]|uniref:phosphate/phosphite/phosphonate ABC transporter substrate-binding protein n=1 Tax=Pseudooceanicola sp. TaxID=1914328 RepID=UPI002639A2D7|nr:PhnD/SsuA/transferrin family substrate-binding protein [Pseudooceanicola sp.]MDF1853893.1 PhnD/SsuA/transferrin family substrate-binding protein [Pseudooceanicola sp.]
MSRGGLIAALPMYDRPESRSATDALWVAIRDQLRTAGIAAPEGLSHDGDLWAEWQSPDLLLSQTCGLPFRSRLHRQVALVATPDYGLPGCAAGQYNSVIAMRAGDPRRASAQWRDLRLAYNDPLSQSGWAAAVDAVAQRGGGFAECLQTGGHAASARAVTEGRADICFIDAQSWRLMRRDDPVIAALAEVGRTPPTPGLPLITAPGRDVIALRTAVGAAIAALSESRRAQLGLNGLVVLPEAAYLAQPIPAPPPIGRV